MLNVYALPQCPHCQLTVGYLEDNGIEFNYLHIEKQPDEVVQKVIEVNGGKHWVVPTLEYNGKWRPGRVYNKKELEQDLKNLGVIS